MTDLNLRSSIAQRLNRYLPYTQAEPDIQVEGRLLRMVGLTLEAVGCSVPIGGHCTIRNHDGLDVEAEVVGFSGNKMYLMPIEPVSGLQPGARVIPNRLVAQVPVGMNLLGRVLDGRGQPLDGKGALKADGYTSLSREAINPLERQPIIEPMDVGVRAINSLLTVGRGQRMGLFAGSGVGKSVLLGMMTRFTTADITVVGLIGERGREVKEFIEHSLGEEGLRRSVVVASPADDSPLMRMHGAMLATAIAEHFRDQGKNVLLLMDSLTRYAQAQREIALAIGEPPATKGYPPSVFAKLPALVERAGNGKEGGGSITAFYTVLTEGDDVQDPVADSARAILDGHVVLARRLAEEGQYPAIDIEASISRAMPQVVTEEHLKKAQLVKRLYARYQQSRDLISVGAYVAGSDPETDLAIHKIKPIRDFLAQSMSEKLDYKTSLAGMDRLFEMK
ncbi:flagellar protein export ATPase FliI [Ketobacter sp. MCCC 1A13808]|uniref:flagellar protein export ATPase FliI n=1 Tax=Ketobacter sp. MCCC 1A13808 TaxID=2602738 RepID=UPI0012EBB578|nr:flagellar protein export ATPase FliI [Ketobacter sp. MCCC 1A13808]MVF12845.1 flagellar protein export ATPase FliI [Ketobacter sp. MCCC 1A13808]